MRAISLFIILLLILALGICFAQNQPADVRPKALFRIQVDGKWGYIDQTGKVRIPPQFSHAERFYSGFACADGFYIDDTGRKIAMRPGMYACDWGAFYDGLAPFTVEGGKYGYIDKTGAVVIPPKFFLAGCFKDGLARVTTQPHYKPFGPAPNEQAEFEAKGAYAFIDKTGNVVCGGYSNAWDFREGLAAVKADGKWGYVDAKGAFVVQPRLDEAYELSEGLGRVLVDHKWGYIDKSGKMVIAPQFIEPVDDFSDGLAVVWIQRKAGCIDKTGKLVIEAKFDSIRGFTEGLSPFYANEKMGYIDHKGNVAIPPTFDDADWFRNGLAQVTVGEKMGYIDKTGHYVWVPSK